MSMKIDALRQRPRKAEKGQSLVEMALGMVILIMLLSGLLDLGRIWYIYVALEDAAGEAALYLSLDPFCLDETDERPTLDPALKFCTDPNNAEYRARNAVGQDVLDWSLVQEKVTVPLDLLGNPVVDVGEQVSVELTYPVQLLTPIIPQFVGFNPLVLKSHATQTIIREWKDDS